MDLFGLSEFLCALVGSPELIGCLWSSQHCQDGQRARVRDNPPPPLFVLERRCWEFQRT